VQDIQVEQDLVKCRALVEIFSNPVLGEALAFRGGTALYKLYLKPAARYSKDIDLAQMRAEPAGPVMDGLRSVLDPWLGAPRWKQTEGLRHVCVPVCVRRRPADQNEAESGNQLTGAFRGSRVQARSVQRRITLVRGQLRATDFRA
jgi:hypothetical protein